MPKFRASICYSVSECVGEIEAENEEEAQEKAALMGKATLCHQCADHLNDLIVEEVHLEQLDDNGNVVNTLDSDLT